MLPTTEINPLAKMVLLALISVAIGSCGKMRTGAADEVAQVAVNDSSELAVIAYYLGDGMDLDRYDFNKVTHIIYSFVHLDGNQISFLGPEAIETYQRLVALKQTYPHLKVMFALGGWGGCEPCSEIFADPDNRKAFAQSTLGTLRRYGGDGLDLDWEYPSIEGHPGHPYGPGDKANFTALVKELRQTLGEDYLLSFAAGGFTEFLEKSVDWHAIMPLLNNVNLMSYDLVNGFSKVTGHHTPLYSTPAQKESTDNAVQYLLNLGVPAEKIIIGAAFYSRVWENVDSTNNGLYQSGVHIPGIRFTEIPQTYTVEAGYQYLWDDVAKAPYVYHPEKKQFATFDDTRSMRAKTQYVKQQQLGGIMFWQLPGDHDTQSLVDVIYDEKIAP